MSAHANFGTAVAPPPPKQFTDEELKQQYGIHLATRLQTDEDGKESKWADIDDDEEDWAPETVIWMDGTKSTLTPSEAMPVEKEQKPAPQQAAKPAEGVRPTLALKKTIDSGPPKTILKPGVAAQQAKQQTGVTAASSGTEKPSLKAKSPAPHPSKSPWAALPPVEAISPLNPPVQLPPQLQQPTSLPTQDARAYESQPLTQPARQIAADTFDRSWREGEGGARELFNSANGRYEPAPEGRRSSIKPESAHRKPSVLQRPSQSGTSPAEPSAAFQSRTGSQTDGAPWPRRRGSSVSQGSLPPGRRMSTSKPPELEPTAERRPSTVVGHDLRLSPKASRSESVRPNFAQQSTWDQQMPPQPPQSEPVTEVEDPVKVQERIMREKRELAVKRRKEEEERLEAEKQERLKAKLAALAGAGKSKREREAEANVVAVVETPVSERQIELTPSTSKASDMPAAPSQTAEASTELAPDLRAQAQAPAPAQDLPLAPESVYAQLPVSEEEPPSPLPPKPQPAGFAERPVSSANQGQRQGQAPRAHLSPRANARAPFSQQQPSPYKPPTSSYSSPGERKNQSFGRAPLTNNDTFSPWPTTGANGNVWGTSGIGNGTFEKASSFAPVPIAQQNSALPPPPGMRPATSTRISPQGFGQEPRSPSLQQSQAAEQQRTFPPPGIEARPEATWGQPRANGVSPAPGLGRPPHAPGPIAPPSRAHQQQQQASIQRPDALAAWNNAAQRMPHQYAADAETTERKKEEGVIALPREDTIKETFKQTSAEQGRLSAPRRYEKTESAIHDAQGSRSVSTLSPAPPNAQTQPIGPTPTASPLTEHHKQVGENTVRIPDGSLNPAHGGLPVQQASVIPPLGQQQPLIAYQGNAKFPTSPLAPVVGTKDQSPPPPETSSHPVNIGGDVMHPHVKLPPPPPVVKLPPAPASQPPSMRQPTPVMMPQRPVQVWGPPGAARPIVMNEDWQARFNGLFNRAPIQTEVPPSPPKTPPKSQQGPALAVASSSKALLDDLPAVSSATVSLPQNVRRNVTAEGFTIDDSADLVSKPTMEQMFNEELSFGSLPKIAVPRNPLYDDDVYHTPTQNNMLKMATNSRFLRQVDAQSEPDVDFRAFFNKHPAGYFVKLPGTIGNRLVRINTGGRKETVMQQQHDRKTSGKSHKTKPNKDGVPEPPAINGTPGAGSRKTSSQKVPTPAPASPTTGGSAANAEGGKRRETKWARQPRGRNQPVASS